jgi:hypothetical protein
VEELIPSKRIYVSELEVYIQFAVELNIELLYISTGDTDRLQPLGRRVFGALKSESRRLFRRQASCNPELKRRKAEAVQDVIAVWHGLSDFTSSANVHGGS